jgi:sulfur transfer complex TusBCD TusB component (DsrH family)
MQTRTFHSSLMALTLLAVVSACPAESGSESVKLAAIMDFELIDDMRAYETAEVLAAQDRRIVLISDALRKDLEYRGMYRIADNNTVAAMITDLQARQALRDCNGCEIDIGRALSADVVVIGWVQKVSNLIVNINIEVRDVGSGQMLYVKSVDLRSNTDRSWLRGIRFMVDSIAEKRQHLR